MKIGMHMHLDNDIETGIVNGTTQTMPKMQWQCWNGRNVLRNEVQYDAEKTARNVQKMKEKNKLAWLHVAGCPWPGSSGIYGGKH